MTKDLRTRSFVKSITWRVLATASTIIVVFVFTNEWVLSAEIGGVTLVANLMLYYIHERMWSKAQWGTQ